MTNSNDKSGSPLRPSKTTPSVLSDTEKESFHNQLVTFDDRLFSLLKSQCFYHEAMLNLLTSQDEPDSDTLIGAIVIQRWLRESGDHLLSQLREMQGWLNRPRP